MSREKAKADVDRVIARLMANQCMKLRTMARGICELAETRLQPFRLTFGEYELLSMLERGPLTEAAVCARIGRSAPSVSRWLQRLESEGWTSPQCVSNDRRQFVVSLTGEGSKHLDNARTALVSALVDLDSNLSHAEKSMLM